MKITFAGVGSAAASKNLYQSNMVIEKNGKLLLVDAGGDIRHSLGELPYGIHSGNVGTKIDAVYVSHLHADHIGGMEWVGLCSKFTPPYRRPHLFCNHTLMNELWDTSLKGGMQTIEGKVADLTDFFECHPVADNGEFVWEGIQFQPVQTIHIVSGRKFQNSYGLLMIEGGIRKAFLTTDTQYAPYQLNGFYHGSRVIFHDCETSPFRSNVHAHYDDLKTLPAEVKERMWLYHYNQDIPPQNALADGFSGFVKKGQTFEL